MTVTEIATVIAGATPTPTRAQAPADWRRELIGNLRSYAPNSPPMCAESLPENTRLRRLCISARRGDDVSREDREDMALAGLYASTLREHAAREAAKLDALFGAWREFAVSDVPAERECAALIDRFVRVAWRMELVSPPTLHDGRKLSVRVSHNAISGLLPDMGY